MKINHNKLNFLIETLLLIWFFIVYSAYIYFHPNPLSFLPIICGGLFLIAFWYFIIKPIKNSLKIEINKPLWQISIFLLIAILGTAAFIRLLGNIFAENLNFIPFLATEFNVVLSILSKTLFLSGLILISASVGKKLFNIFKFKIEDAKEEFIFSFGLGFLAINYLAFFLTALGWLYFWPSLILIIALVVFAWKQIKYFVKNFLKAKFKFNISADFKDLKPWTWVIIGFFIIISFLITFRVSPVKIDDIVSYFNVPHLYSYYHSLVPFHNAPAAIPSGIGMSFYALINTLFAPHFVFQLTWLFFIFLISTIYLFAKKFFSEKIALTAILLSVFIPWNSFFITTQKVIFIFAFISALALFSFFIWLKDKKNHWLYITAMLLGYATSIKTNGLFLILSLAIFLFILFVAKKISLKQGAIFSSIIFLFFLPIIALNIYYYNAPLAPSSIFPSIKKTETMFTSGKKVTLHDIYKKTDFDNKRIKEFTLLGRQNQPTDSAFLNFFWLLWNITVNQTGIKFLYIGISPYLLIFLPLFAFYFIKNKYYKEKNILSLTLISFIFGIVWCLRGAERPWYGIAIFYFLFILSAIALQQIKNKKYIFIIYFFIILFSIRTLAGLGATITMLPNTIYYPHTTCEDTYNDIPRLKIYDFINKEIISKNNDALILMFLELTSSNIEKNNKTTISDRRSIYWGKIIEETNSLEEVKNILKNQGITHVLYNISFKNGIMQLAEKDPQNEYGIIKDIEAFEKFKNKYLTEMHCDEEQFCVYEIL
jgi:hypothetical protein